MFTTWVPVLQTGAFTITLPAVINNAQVRAMGVEPINLSHLLLRQASVPFEYARVGAERFELSSVKERYLKPPCIPFHHAPVCIRRGSNSQSRSRARGLKPRAYTISATDAYHIHFSDFRVAIVIAAFLFPPYNNVCCYFFCPRACTGRYNILFSRARYGFRSRSPGLEDRYAANYTYRAWGREVPVSSPLLGYKSSRDKSRIDGTGVEPVLPA